MFTRGNQPPARPDTSCPAHAPQLRGPGGDSTGAAERIRQTGADSREGGKGRSPAMSRPFPALPRPVDATAVASELRLLVTLALEPALLVLSGLNLFFELAARTPSTTLVYLTPIIKNTCCSRITIH